MTERCVNVREDSPGQWSLIFKSTYTLGNDSLELTQYASIYNNKLEACVYAEADEAMLHAIEQGAEVITFVYPGERTSFMSHIKGGLDFNGLTYNVRPDSGMDYMRYLKSQLSSIKWSNAEAHTELVKRIERE